MFRGRHIQNSKPTTSSAVCPTANQIRPASGSSERAGPKKLEATIEPATKNAAAHHQRVRTPLVHHWGQRLRPGTTGTTTLIELDPRT